MVVTVLCASKVSILKRWHKALDSDDTKVYIAKDKSELFDYFNLNRSPITLILESKFNDEKNEEFLKLLRRTYPWIRVCILSYEPTVKEASELLGLGVRGYGNAYMNQIHLKEMVKSIWIGKFWFYPKFLDSFKHEADVEKSIEPIGRIEVIKSLVIARINEEENIILIDEDVFEDEFIMTPYEDSFVGIKLKNEEYLEIGEDSKILLDETTFKMQSLSKRTIFDEDKCNDILSSLGANNILLKKNIQENDASDKGVLAFNESEDGIEAVYSGNFNEYDIYPSKNLPGFIVIKDRVERRDGSDLISASISKCIFLDTEKTYNELIGNSL